jgi:hypothetical protein
MTSSLVLDKAADLSACLDRVTTLGDEAVGADELAALLRLAAQGEARLAAWRLAILARADRSDVAARSGAASTGQWAAQSAKVDPGAAHREVGLAQGLQKRTATQRALAAGEISAAHAQVIVQADRQLPTGLRNDQREVVEATLIAQARQLAPGALRKAARRALQAVEDNARTVDEHENGIVRDREEDARRRTRLTLHDNGDGTMTGHFTVPIVHGELLRRILQTITAPRRGRLGADAAQLGEPEDRTDWARATGLAFCEILEHLPTDHLHPKTAATMVVHLDADVLHAALRVAGLDTDEALSAGEARRLACSAGLIPAVFGGASLPLDLGRERRLFTETQRVALGARHRTCTAAGCERPFAWCELHHRRAWSRGGSTDLADAVPLCHFHHRRIHDHDYGHTRGPDGGITFYRRT